MGLFGGLLAFLLQWGIYTLMSDLIGAYSIATLIDIIPFRNMIQYVLPVFLGAGFLVGIGGSLSAIKNYLKV